MFRDIVIPKNNEAEFIEVASRLGIKKLCFLYDFEGFNEEKVQKKLNALESQNHVEIVTGFLVTQNNINKALKQSNLLVAKSSDKDRAFIESKKIKMIYGFEELHKKDYLHQRASGLNHIVCELARKNNVAIGFSYSSLFKTDIASSSLLIGRVIQNINLCRKFKVNTIIGAFSERSYDLRSPYDLASLFKLFGAEPKNIKNSIYSDL